MADHGARGHAKWSASATARNVACPGALALGQRVAPKDTESEAAAWGTACHQVSERCLREGKDAAAFIGTVERTKERDIPVDDELAECAQVYVDYCRALRDVVETSGGFTAIEQYFSFDAINPPMEAGGTADFTAYFREERRLEVVDLKGGRGVRVEVAGNAQLRSYALGAMLANPGLGVSEITVTIVQPRAPHKDGRIRSETFATFDLIEWANDLLLAMKMSACAEREATDPLKDVVWQTAYLRAGDHCKFCPAAGVCPRLERDALDKVGVWFDPVTDEPRISNAPDTLPSEELAKRLDALDMIEDWIQAVRAYAHAQAESGVVIPNYQLVERVGRRAWAADEEKIVYDLRNVVGLPDDVLWTRKLKSPAQIEKELGSKRKGEIKFMWSSPVTGTNLVRVDKTNRPPLRPVVEKYFQAVN